MKLLIRNLARATTEAALKEMFETYGKVQSCTLVIDKDTGASKGFGFVEMPKIGDAKAAMKNLNNQEVDSNKIRVKKAELKSQNGEISEGKKPDKAEVNNTPVTPSVWDRK